MRGWLYLLIMMSVAGVARAGEQILEYQLIAHATEVHAVSVPGQEDHEMGVATFRGLAVFHDGRIAHHWYTGTFDFVEGSGPIGGYALWVFDDGARLQARYTGTAKATADGGITFEGRHTRVQGTGIYTGARGEGRFTGQRVNHLREGEGDVYQQGILSLSLPTE